MTGTDLQSVLGYPVEITNPETGEIYLIERSGFSRGNWSEWRMRWNRWKLWNRGRGKGNEEERNNRQD